MLRIEILEIELLVSFDLVVQSVNNDFRYLPSQRKGQGCFRVDVLVYESYTPKN
jgi:hypothetical protein